MRKIEGSSTIGERAELRPTYAILVASSEEKDSSWANKNDSPAVDFMDFETSVCWDGKPAPEQERARLRLEARGGDLILNVRAPFYGDPPPSSPAGPCWGLWEFEVVEFLHLLRFHQFQQLFVREKVLHCQPMGLTLING